ncbi:MAG: 2-amino-4-hydroxy-6-hydroxymethyldihydropteridine diphosphokinase [Firmicutes bacterium]|nr:2-amino-4-hydroxy-6-hydroxymethyldihydropteridine diphosphokinase [Bacillota bacterium]
METFYVGLGANLGERQANLTGALAGLAGTPGVRITGCSSVYETEPMGPPGQPLYLNAVARGDTRLPPLDLLRVFKELETRMGRRPGLRWGPRCIDLDLLLYGSVQLEGPELTVPHPGLALRAFVLLPLVELAPSLVLPDGRPIRTLLDQLGSAQAPGTLVPGTPMPDTLPVRVGPPIPYPDLS